MQDSYHQPYHASGPDRLPPDFLKSVKVHPTASALQMLINIPGGMIIRTVFLFFWWGGFLYHKLKVFYNSSSSVTLRVATIAYNVTVRATTR